MKVDITWPALKAFSAYRERPFAGCGRVDIDNIGLRPAIVAVAWAVVFCKGEDLRG